MAYLQIKRFEVQTIPEVCEKGRYVSEQHMDFESKNSLPIFSMHGPDEFKQAYRCWRKAVKALDDQLLHEPPAVYFPGRYGVAILVAILYKRDGEETSDSEDCIVLALESI